MYFFRSKIRINEHFDVSLHFWFTLQRKWGKIRHASPVFPACGQRVFFCLSPRVCGGEHYFQRIRRQPYLCSKRCPLAGRFASVKASKLRIRPDLCRRFHCPSIWLQPAYRIAHWPSMWLKTTTTVSLPIPRQELFFKATQNTGTSGKGSRAPK